MVLDGVAGSSGGVTERLTVTQLDVNIGNVGLLFLEECNDDVDGICPKKLGQGSKKKYLETLFHRLFTQKTCPVRTKFYPIEKGKGITVM